MKKLLIIVFIIGIFVFGRNLLYPTYTKNNVIYTRDMLGRITGSEALKYSPSKNTSDYSDRTPDPTIKFDIDIVKIGDKVGTMTITKIDENSKGDFVSFKGQVVLSGEVYDNPEWASGEIVCIENLDEESLSKLPKINGDDRGSANICFNNMQDVKKIFQNNEKRKSATILIDNYQINNGYFIGALYDNATFISWIK